MARALSARIGDLLTPEGQRALAAVCTSSARTRDRQRLFATTATGGELPPVDPDDDLAGFHDTETLVGFFQFEASECRSRRVDLDNPLDLDPGPIPTEEAPEGCEGVWLRFSAA